MPTSVSHASCARCLASWTNALWDLAALVNYSWYPCAPKFAPCTASRWANDIQLIPLSRYLLITIIDIIIIIGVIIFQYRPIYYYFFTLGIYSRRRFKNWWKRLKGMMLSPCSQGPAGCSVAGQHWNAAPAPKLADTNIVCSLSGVTRNWGDPPAKIIQKPNGWHIENVQGFNGYWFKHDLSNNARVLYLLASGRQFCCRPCLTGGFSDIWLSQRAGYCDVPAQRLAALPRNECETIWSLTGTARWALWWREPRQRQSCEQSSRWEHDV